MLALVVIAIAALIVGGHVLANGWEPHRARPVAWAVVVLGTAIVERLVTGELPVVRMTAMIAFAMAGMKVIVVVEERARGMAPLAFGAWLQFAGGWLGMRPRPFLGTSERSDRSGAMALMRRGLVHAFVGAALVVSARGAWQATRSHLLSSALLLPGLSLLVHFGLCNVLAGAWRCRGVATDALFRAPLRSESLAEFWSKRWNLAFSEMTAIAVYRPLAERFGRTPALIAGFLVSGVLHEMAISVPVRAGLGLPMLYFALHGALVLVERALAAAGRPVRGWAGRAWAMFWLVAPLPLLFHRAFLAGVIWPLIGIPVE